MASKVICDQKHDGGLCRLAAIEISERGSLGKCDRRDCGAQRRYIIDQTYANTSSPEIYELVKVARLFDNDTADKDGYDPMIFLIKEIKSGDPIIWPFWWGKDQKGRWRVGQFPPQFSPNDFKKLVSMLGI